MAKTTEGAAFARQPFFLARRSAEILSTNGRYSTVGSVKENYILTHSVSGVDWGFSSIRCRRTCTMYLCSLGGLILRSRYTAAFW